MKLEYGLLIALIASVLVIGITHTSRALYNPFDNLQAVMNEMGVAACTTDTQKGEP